MKKGRPIGSDIRQHVIEILYFMGKGYGYEIYKVYMDLFPAVTMRSIYYHLKKGASIGEFKVEKVQIEKGNYSWGGEAEKIYYALGKNAKPLIDQKVKKYFEDKR